MTARIYCAQCAARQDRGTYVRCPDCGAALCRRRRTCAPAHSRQCPATHDPRETL